MILEKHKKIISVLIREYTKDSCFIEVIVFMIALYMAFGQLFGILIILHGKYNHLVVILNIPLIAYVCYLLSNARNVYMAIKRYINKEKLFFKKAMEKANSQDNEDL